MEYVELGNTGLRVSRLSIGTGTAGWAGKSEQTALGLDGLASLLRQGYNHGINFWDSADQYGSHRHIAHALRDIPREQVVISTKVFSRSASRVKRDVERFRKELDTDVLDILLLHLVAHRDWQRRRSGTLEALSAAKSKGLVKAVGVSCHNLGALRQAAVSDWVDVVLVRINYAGVNMDASPAEVVPAIERLYSSGKGVYGMKVLGVGQLADDAQRAMEYVLGLGTVHAVTIGMSSRHQLSSNLKIMETLGPRFPLAAPRDALE